MGGSVTNWLLVEMLRRGWLSPLSPPLGGINPNAVHKKREIILVLRQ